ncbi:MAG: ABC transporter ATP-binding protein, partial [bacterium]|nr:ABC transporter ATP-binding protein [bacterium]
MKRIELENISHRFALPDKKEVTAVESVNLTVREGEFLAIIGESGCGKSTLLNIIAGLLKPSSGNLLVDGEPISGPHHSRMMMFQQPCLLPWLTVEQNIAFGCKLRKEDKKLYENVSQLIDTIGLKGFEKAYPNALSAGMLQRTALARSLIGNPEILLMDESFSDVDFFTRVTLLELVTRLWKKLGLTAILVTHDIEEALLLAQRIILLGDRPGTIKHTFQVDLPYPRSVRNPELYKKKTDILD